MDSGVGWESVVVMELRLMVLMGGPDSRSCYSEWIESSGCVDV